MASKRIQITIKVVYTPNPNDYSGEDPITVDQDSWNKGYVSLEELVSWGDDEDAEVTFEYVD